MTELCQFNVLPKSGIWSILCQLMVILAKCFDIYELLICFAHHLHDFDIQTKFEVNWTQIGHSIPPNKTPKNH